MKKNFEKKNVRKKKDFEKIIFEFFLAYNTRRPPMSVHKIFKPIRLKRLAGYREHLYECLVLLYRQISHKNRRSSYDCNYHLFIL